MQSYTRCSRVKPEKECVFLKKRKSRRTAESEIAEKKIEGYNGVIEKGMNAMT